MRKILFTLIFSCITIVNVFASELTEKSYDANCLNTVSVVNPVLCFPVKLSCWENPHQTCFDESYTFEEIVELVGLMEDVWCAS